MGRILYDEEIDLQVPKGLALEALKVRVQVMPPGGGCLLYFTMANGALGYIEVRGPGQVGEIPAAKPNVLVKRVLGAEQVSIELLGYRLRRPANAQSAELTDPERWRLRAEEYLAAAESMTTNGARRAYASLAAQYQEMADRRESRIKPITPEGCQLRADLCEQFAEAFTLPRAQQAIRRVAAQWRLRARA